MSIDDFFLGNTNDQLQRNHIFADRVVEQDLLMQKIVEINSRRLTPEHLLDYRRSAANICVVHGEGGIGKSAMMRQVAKRFHDLATDRRRQCAVVIDFGDFTNHDFETVLMRIRGGLANLHHEWPAFDLVFSYYWQQKHPGAGLLRSFDHIGFLSGEERGMMKEQLAGVLDAMLGGTGLMSAGYRVMSLVRNRYQESNAIRKLRADYPPFARLLDEAEPDAILGYLPALLAYDLEMARRKKDFWVLFLLDTLEYVQLARQGKGAPEDLISRLIYLMPNAPFMVTTRRPLDWYEEYRAENLTYGGQERWSLLAPGAAGQYRLTGLDSRSADDLLAASLTLDGRAAMPPLVRERIIHGSYGLPLYLELSLNWYRQSVLRGRDVEESQVADSFPELVLSLIRDLVAIDRDLLRAAAILEVFDEELLLLLVPTARQVQVKRFLAFSFITRMPESWLPYSLHQVFRRAVILHDRSTHDAWSPDEWKHQALKAISWLEEQSLAIWLENRMPFSSFEDAGRVCVSALLLCATAAVEHGVQPSRIGELAFTVRQFGYRRAFDSLSATAPTSGTDLRRLLEVVRTSATHESSPVECLEQIEPYARYEAESSVDYFIAAELGVVAEVAGSHSIAHRAYESMLSGPAQIREFGALGLAYNYLRSGRLATALSIVPDRLSHPFFRSSVLDFQGHTHLQGGEFTKAAEFFGEGLKYAREAHSPLLIARGMRHLAHVYMWYDADAALAMIPEAMQINEALGEEVGVAQCEMAIAMALAWKRDWDGAWAALRRCQSHGLDPLAIGHPWMIETLLCKGTGDEEGAMRAAERVFSDQRVARTDASRPHVWYAVTAFFANRPDLADFGAVEWYDSEDEARQRWSVPLARMVSSGNV